MSCLVRLDFKKGDVSINSSGGSSSFFISSKESSLAKTALSKPICFASWFALPWGFTLSVMVAKISRAESAQGNRHQYSKTQTKKQGLPECTGSPCSSKNTPAAAFLTTFAPFA